MEGTVRVRAGDGFVKVEAEPDRALRVDAAGRWITARLGATTLRRKVDGGVFIARGEGADAPPVSVGDLRPPQLAGGRRDGDPLPPAASYGLRPAVGYDDSPATGPWHAQVAELAATLRADLAAAAAGARPLEVRPADALPHADRVLARAAALGPADYAALGRRFAEVYAEPVPILPPDRYRDLVVLPAVGCPHGVCTFCAWYQDARFRVFSDDDLRAHLDGLEELFGAGLRSRDGLFLGSASGLSVADARLLRLIDLVIERFGPPPRGIAAFLDPHHAPRRDAAAWARLAERGLVRAVVGLETGDPALRARLGKSADLAPLRDAVGAMRAGGVGAGITVLTGAVAPEDTPAHHAATVAFVAGLDLDERDLVYVSPLDRAADPAAAAREATALTAALRGASGAKVSPYRVDLYRYFA